MLRNGPRPTHSHTQPALRSAPPLRHPRVGTPSHGERLTHKQDDQPTMFDLFTSTLALPPYTATTHVWPLLRAHRQRTLDCHTVFSVYARVVCLVDRELSRDGTSTKYRKYASTEHQPRIAHAGGRPFASHTDGRMPMERTAAVHRAGTAQHNHTLSRSLVSLLQLPRPPLTSRPPAAPRAP